MLDRGRIFDVGSTKSFDGKRPINGNSLTASVLDDPSEDVEEENELPSRLTQRRSGRRRNRNKARHRGNYDVKAVSWIDSSYGVS